MTSRACTIGLDVGTTSVKAMGFDEHGRELVRASTDVPTVGDDRGAAEQDPTVVYTAVMDVLGRATVGLRAHGLTPTLLGFSAAMHSVIPVSDDGTPLGHALLWMDTRAGDAARALLSSPETPDLYARTGTPIHAMSPLCKLLWLRRQHADVFTAAAKFVSIKEWIWHRWFGEWQVDASIASATGLYNLRDGAWDAGALRLAGIGADRLSALVPTTYSRPVRAHSPLATVGIAPYSIANIGASDGVLANLGAGAISGDRMVITIGTSCAVRAGRATPFTDPASQSFCYVLDATHYIVGGPSNSGGVVLAWLARHILSTYGTANGPAKAGVANEDASSGAKNAIAALVAASERADPDDLLCLPYITGERAPIWREDASGIFVGLRLHHTAVDLMRAAIEGIIFNATVIASRLSAFEVAPREIVATGHVMDAQWIRQLTADAFGLPVRHLGPVDASATGAALLALLATNIWSPDDYRVFQAQLPAEVLQPTGASKYDNQLRRFRRLISALTGDLADIYLDR